MHQQETLLSPITATLVPDFRRLSVLPRYFGHHMIAVEGAIYDALREICNAYHGGYWEYYELSNGAFFMAPTGADNFTLTCAGNYFQGELSAEATGIVASLLGINRALWAFRTQQLDDRFYGLREFAIHHPEAVQIMAAID
ncbi:antirestriction protein [Pseudomonas hunanensis]|uniref:Antirestriction protein n=1 Tax=Pseudomonas hunanensis TaxID=1247546 RepID=A0ABD6N9W6_9PSED|nr:antirestriction protein [Pseudomonas hunanensis]ALG88787.1 Antirestriction protein KlcA [uncultured bacterium]NWL45447.1 antirestriction protein [Pseudomonas hunanensis]